MKKKKKPNVEVKVGTNIDELDATIERLAKLSVLMEKMTELVKEVEEAGKDAEGKTPTE